MLAQKNHIPKMLCIFDRGCVHTVRHLYGYAAGDGEYISLRERRVCCVCS